MKVVYRFAGIVNAGDHSRISFGITVRFIDPETGEEKQEELNGNDNLFDSLEKAIEFTLGKDLFILGGSVTILPFLISN